MAHMYSILGALRNEVEGRIRALTPNGLSNTKFRTRPIKDRSAREFRQCSGKLRLFELTLKPIRQEERTVGSSVKKYRVDFTLQGWYQDTPDWERAAIDDFDQISTDLNQNTSTATGVHIREIDYTQAFDLSRPNADDPWLLATAVLYAIIETTQ